MFRHVIWDFDGTLFNTYPGVAHTFLKILKEQHGKEFKYEDVLKWSKYSLKLYAENLSEDINTDQTALIEAFHEEYMSNGAPIEEPPFAGAKEMCELVDEQGGLNLLVTHRGGMTLRRLLEKYNMKKHLKELISRDEDFPRKPDPAAFLYLIDKYNLDNENILAIGDRELDVKAAHNAGITACYFSPNGEKYEESDYNIDYLGKLESILTK